MNPHFSVKDKISLDRRGFLAGLGASVIVAFNVEFSGAARAATTTSVGAYIAISSSNTVTISIGASEMGQGIATGMAMLAAEELMVDWTTVTTVFAPAAAAYANPLFNFQVTGGSTSMRGWFTPMRQAAAAVREMLITAGATNMKVARSTCSAAHGKVLSGAKSVPYSAIAAAAALLQMPDPTKIPLITNFKVIGQSLARTDIPSKVNGSAVFGIDVRVPGMLFASVIHAPAVGATVGVMPAKPQGAVAVVDLTNAVAVVATNTWDAMQMARGLRVTWNTPSSAAGINSAAILQTARSLATAGTAQVQENAGSPDQALASAVAKIDIEYQLPYLAHACLEVLNCTASVTPTSCEIWAPTQGQATNVLTATALLGLTPSQVKIHTTYLGGGLGRKFEQDFVAQAIQISKAVKAPVKLVWSREQDFLHDKYRPTALIRVQAGLDSKKALTSLIFRNVSPSIAAQNGAVGEDPGALSGALGMPYALPNRRIEYVPNPALVPVGYWRSVGESYNTFAVESAIDELAALAKVDPVAFRASLLAGKTRELAVLNAVAELSGWGTALPSGHARGVAFLSGFGSLIAEVAEISLNGSGQIKVNNMYCAIDCGVAVNPALIESQMQGGIAHGLSATLWGQVTFAAGVASVSNFNKYRMVKMGDMPNVSVQIVNSGAAVGGIGEVAVPCVAPAIANAYFKLTAKRVRTLPFYPGATMGDG